MTLLIHILNHHIRCCEKTFCGFPKLVSVGPWALKLSQSFYFEVSNLIFWVDYFLYLGVKKLFLKFVSAPRSWHWFHWLASYCRWKFLMFTYRLQSFFFLDSIDFNLKRANRDRTESRSAFCDSKNLFTIWILSTQVLNATNLTYTRNLLCISRNSFWKRPRIFIYGGFLIDFCPLGSKFNKTKKIISALQPPEAKVVETFICH